MNEDTTITFCLKELRSIIQLAETIAEPLTASFQVSGDPIVFTVGSVGPNSLEGRLVMATMTQDPVNEDVRRRRLQQQQVEEELARREQQQQANLGPSALDALISRGRQDQAPPSRGSLRRGPVSRGGAGRGRLEVLDNRRPALQPQEEEEDFASNFNSFRQRNSG